MPSLAAYESAVRVVDMLLANYYEEHGQWPELTSLILWGTEISRTEGIGVAEFMYLLGCKPVWADNGKVLGVEQIPIDELYVTLNNGSVVNRPRVDVFASMVTNNKDWITWMLTAVNLALNADGEDESNNFVKKHYAENPTLDRLFGLPGNVLEGTGMSNLIPNTADWKMDSIHEYATDIYLSKVSYSWTLDENGNIDIKNQKEAYMYLLNKVDVITQNFDSTWRLFDSDDYYDWFGGIYNAASYLRNKSGLGKPDTAFFDIRNQNRFVQRDYNEEFEFELRTKILNPNYRAPLTKTPAGMNAIAEEIDNMYGASVLGDVVIEEGLANQLADAALDIISNANDVTLAPGAQSSVARLIDMCDKGLMKASSQKIQKLADAYIKSVLDYGVACCHHTCKDLSLVNTIIQLSSLSAAEKKKFADIVASATNTKSVYNGEGDSDENADQLANNTSQKKSDGQESGGKTAIGVDISETGNAKVSSTLDASEGSSGDSGNSESKSYELTEKSASKSASSSAESNMPAFVIGAIIILIAIFLVGYLRDENDDYDDY